MRKFVYITLFCAASVLTGCWDKPEFIDVIRLGATEKTIELLDCEYGDSTFYLISNVDYRLEVVSGGEWVTVTQNDADSICFSYPSNNGFRRSAELRISYGRRTDNLKILQPGKYEMRVEMSEQTIDVPATGGEYAVDVLTNVLRRDMYVEVSNDRMLTDVLLENNRLTFAVPEATSRDTKTYTLTVYAVDGWGERVSAVLNIVQKSK